MTGAWAMGPQMLGAVELAVRTVNTDPKILRGKRLEYVWRDDGCNRFMSVAGFSDILDDEGRIDGLIGPGCSKGCEATATFAQVKNMPQVSASCSYPSLSNKDEFPLFVRTTSPYGKWHLGYMSLMRWAAWTKASTVGDVTMAPSVGALRSELDRLGWHLGADVQFIQDRFEPAPGDPSPLNPIQAARVRVVVVYAYGPDNRAVAVEAYKQGLTKGWCWMGLDMVSGAEEGLKGTDLAIAQTALSGWVYFEPHNVASPEFFDRVMAASTSIGQTLDSNNRNPTPFSANLYDAVILFALAAGNHLQELSNGKVMVEAMRNASFDGMTGRVEIDQSGDMKESLLVLNYLLGNDGSMKRNTMGVYDALSRHYNPARGYTIVWPGGVGATPKDSPMTCPPGASRLCCSLEEQLCA
jgi:atrial natriuretic peptide receptor A